MKRGGITIAAVATLAVSLTASALVVHRLDRRVADASPDDVLSLPSSKVLRHVSLGYNTLAAELYWTRAVQYFGSKHHSHSSWLQKRYRNNGCNVFNKVRAVRSPKWPGLCRFGKREGEYDNRQRLTAWKPKRTARPPAGRRSGCCDRGA